MYATRIHFSIDLSLNGRVVEKHRYIERYKRAYIYTKVDNTLDSGIVGRYVG